MIRNTHWLTCDDWGCSTDDVDDNDNNKHNNNNNKNDNSIDNENNENNNDDILVMMHKFHLMDLKNKIKCFF